MPAYIYPGQGSQSVGMGKVLADVSPEAAAVWQEADEALGESISRLAWEGPAEELDQTVNAQPALLAASIAAQRALEARLAGGVSAFGPPSYFAGHSMGQYSAMVAAGVLDLADAVRLVRLRGQLMQASSGDGAMAAIIGLPDEQERGAHRRRRSRGHHHHRQPQLARPDRDQRRAGRGRSGRERSQGPRRPASHGPAR